MFKKKKEKSLGLFVLVKWSKEAIECSVGGNINKRVYYLYDGMIIDPLSLGHSNPEMYSALRIKQLKRDGVIVVDMTEGQEIPKESTFESLTRELSGTLQITKRV